MLQQKIRLNYIQAHLDVKRELLAQKWRIAIVSSACTVDHRNGQ